MASLTDWIKAARLRTLPLSVSGIFIGSAIAASKDQFDTVIFILALLTTVAFQVVSNFANDLGDGLKGTDNANRIGPERAIQSGAISPSQMKQAVIYSGIIAMVLALCVILRSFRHDFLYAIIFFILGLLSVVAAIKYTVGANAYGYSGLGDLFVFLFFGLLSVCGSYFLYSKNLHLSVFFPAFSVGMLSVGVLNLNNMRDHDSDKEAGKNTIVVKIGAEFARYYHYYLLGSAFLFSLLYVVINFTSFKQFLFVLAFIPIFLHLDRVRKANDPKDLDPELKKLALSTCLYAILFSLGLVL